MFRRNIYRNHFHELQCARINDESLIGTSASGNNITAVRRHHHHVRIDVIAQKRSPTILLVLMSMKTISFESRATIRTTDAGSVTLTSASGRRGALSHAKSDHKREENQKTFHLEHCFPPCHNLFCLLIQAKTLPVDASPGKK